MALNRKFVLSLSLSLSLSLPVVNFHSGDHPVAVFIALRNFDERRVTWQSVVDQILLIIKEFLGR